MKAIGKLLLLTVVLTLGLCVSAMAAGESGMYHVTAEDGYTVTPQTATGDAVAKTSVTIDGVSQDFYANAEKVTVTFNNAVSGKYYLILAQDANDVPKAENIKYIDQVTADAASVTFNVFPSSLESGKTYYIYLASNDTSGARAKIASFQYYVPYIKGDANDDGEVNIKDVTATLRHVAGIEEQTIEKRILAMDVNDITGPDINDVTKILRYVAQIIDTLD